MVILGGMGNVWGVCLGGALLSYLNYQGLEAVGNNLNNVAGTTFNIPQYTFGIFGVIIVATMLVRPQGLIPTARRKIELEAGVEGGSLYDAEGVMAEDLLTARAVRKEFGGLVACSDVDFTVPKGGIVSLIGPNGAGTQAVIVSFLDDPAAPDTSCVSAVKSPSFTSVASP